MNHKAFVTNLLIAILLAGCASAARIPPTLPATSSPTSTSTLTPAPTSTPAIVLTQIEETKVAGLLLPYQLSPSSDLVDLGRTLGPVTIQSLSFTQNAKWWSSSDRQAAEEILTLGMNPGLGVRGLHEDGITGQGVNVGIIDQPVILGHPEFDGKIIQYWDFGTGDQAGRGSMHGPAVTSLLAGENIGTAPGAKVYFAAVPSWLYDARYYAKALDWLVARNASLPQDEKIRVVSVSSIPSGLGSEYKNQEAWEAAYERALKAGILVLDCTYEHGYTSPCTLDMQDPDNVANCIPQWNGPTDSPHVRIYVPMSQRSMATEREQVFSYQYVGQGGISWTVPYLSGVLAMGWQVNPTLTSSQLLDLVYATAYVTNDKHRIVNPAAFIEMVKRTLEP